VDTLASLRSLTCGWFDADALDLVERHASTLMELDCGLVEWQGKAGVAVSRCVRLESLNAYYSILLRGLCGGNETPQPPPVRLIESTARCVRMLEVAPFRGQPRA
jgi:hypothetical protein